MLQAKFSLEKSHIQFLAQFRQYGFKDKSDVVRNALDRFRAELAQQCLRESADLYAEVYGNDEETREWTEPALEEWPS